jgi:Tfp pilus assembly protein PilW
MTNLRHNQSGLTIVELSIALSITVVLLGIVVGFSVDKLQQTNIQNFQYQLLSNAQRGLDTITNDIRIASAADDNNRYMDPYAPGAPTNELSWASNTTTLVLAIAAKDNHRNIIFDDAHDYVSAKNNAIYYLSGRSVYRRELADSVTGNTATTTCPAAHATSSCPADSDLLDNVSSFSIKYYNDQNQQVTPSNARSIQLSVTLLVHKYNRNITANYTTRMVFRNG